MNKPKVSVVIPVYKVEKYLRQCLDSVINQSLKDIEIIIVDEGDMDNCRVIIDEYEAKDKRIKTIHEKNGGYGVSVNKGFDRATGEYLAIVESDDFIDSTMYEELYAYAKKTDADVVKTPYREFWDIYRGTKNYFRVCGYASKMKKTLPKDKPFSILEYPYLISVHASIWAGIYKTSFMREKNIRFIETKKAPYVDVVFRIDVMMSTNKIAWLDKPFYNYRTTNPGSTVNNYNVKAILQRWKEVHSAFETRYLGTYEAIAKYLIIEEYVCTITLLKYYEFTDEEWKMLKENLSYTSDKIIKKSPVLSKYQKKQIFDIKKKKERKNCLAYYRVFKLKLFNMITLLKQCVHTDGCYKYYLFGTIPLLVSPKKPILKYKTYKEMQQEICCK